MRSLYRRGVIGSALLGIGPVGLPTTLGWLVKLSHGIRLVAVFEGVKGALILLAGFGLLATSALANTHPSGVWATP